METENLSREPAHVAREQSSAVPLLDANSPLINYDNIIDFGLPRPH